MGYLFNFVQRIDKMKGMDDGQWTEWTMDDGRNGRWTEWTMDLNGPEVDLSGPEWTGKGLKG